MGDCRRYARSETRLRSTMAAGSSSSDSTRAAASRRIASLGMPNTTQLASSWAIVSAPASRISLSPRAPSSPMPVMMIPRAFAPAHFAAERNNTSTEGRWRFTGGPSRIFDEVLGAAAPEQHVLAARCNQRPARNHAVIVLRFLDVDLAQRIEPGRECGGELLRHVLHDDDAGRHDGKCRQHLSSACVPPVEVPMTTTCSVVRVIARSPAGRG